MARARKVVSDLSSQEFDELRRQFNNLVADSWRQPLPLRRCRLLLLLVMMPQLQVVTSRVFVQRQRILVALEI